MVHLTRRGVAAWALAAALGLLSAAATAEPPPSPPAGARPVAAEQPTLDAAQVVESETTADGEKSYQFRAVEVEGRLKAPQILYFLRRVRAEFRSDRLGHRSFLPELGDTRRSSALR